MPIPKESHVTELKKSLAQLDDSLKSVCAFLNHKGGTVYFGVANDGEIRGLDVSDRTLRKISQQIHARIKPEITPELREVKENIPIMRWLSVQLPCNYRAIFARMHMLKV